MFVWRAQTVLDALADHLPETADGAARGSSRAAPGPARDAVLAEVFPTLPKISVDYAVLEPAAAEPGRVLVADLDVDWLDVGSWPALAHTLDADGAGNAVRGLTVVARRLGQHRAQRRPGAPGGAGRRARQRGGAHRRRHDGLPRRPTPSGSSSCSPPSRSGTASGTAEGGCASLPGHEELRRRSRGHRRSLRARRGHHPRTGRRGRRRHHPRPAGGPRAGARRRAGRAHHLRPHRRHRRGVGAGRDRRGDRQGPAAADRGQLRRHRLGAAHRRPRRRAARPRRLHDDGHGQPGRHVQRAPAGRGGDGRDRAGRGRRARRRSSTPPRSPPTTGRSARSPTRRPRAASSA